MCQGANGSSLVKPQIDTFEYRVFTLANGLKVMLVSDKDTHKAAAAMDVRVGSMSDPDDIPGLAHFTEHMLFYASEKYPVEDEYSKFISDHGGHTNAYTSAESTNYHFDVNADHLEPALDRFAQFFICPLVSKDGVEREANAVDSEHGKNLNQDQWRRMQLWKSTSNKQHPFSKFSTGNVETLLEAPKQAGLDIHEKVKEFHGRYYSSNVMRLVVYGKDSLDDLHRMVEEKFNGVHNKQLPVPDIPDTPLTADHTCRLIKMVPEKEEHLVEIQWMVPPEWKDYQYGPCQYLGSLLGDEGEGSIFALLKAKGWATSLVAGESGNSFSSRSFFMIRIELTEEGNNHVCEALSVVSQYIRLLRGPGAISEASWQDYKMLQEMRFNFRDKSPPFGYAQSLASTMQLYSEPDVLLGMYSVPQQFDAERIRAVLNDMTPKKCRVMWASKAVKDDAVLVERWYGTNYTEGPVPPKWIDSWESDPISSGLHVPKQNPFIPSDFKLIQPVSSTLAEPQVVFQSELSSLWYKADTSFNTPKAVVYFDIISPQAYATPENAVMTKLITRLLQDYLNELTYPAQVAGLYYGISCSTTGMTIQLTGYNHKVPLLLNYILDKMGAFEVKRDRFEVQRAQQEKEYINMVYTQPYSHALYSLSVMMEHPRWHADEYRAVIGAITPQDIMDFYPKLFSRVGVLGYVTGNMDEGQAKELLTSLETTLTDKLSAQPLFSAQRPEKRVIKLPIGKPYVLPVPGPNPANENSAIVVVYQVGPDNLSQNVLTELFVHIAKRDAFHQLRTVEQLGYICTAHYLTVATVNSVSFIIQSTAYSAQHMDGRVEAFLNQLAQRFEGLSDTEWQAQVDEVAKAKLDKPKSLRQQAARDWMEIQDGTRVFERQSKEVEVLRKLQKPQLIQFAQEVVFDISSRRKLSVHVKGANEAKQAEKGAEEGANEEAKECPAEVADVITDMWSFKRASELFPSPM